MAPSIPDPRNPESFAHRSLVVPTSGHTYHYIDQAPSTTPVNVPADLEPIILCLHGFPELWWTFRYQINAFTKQGWRVIAPSMLGYADTSKPKDNAAYSSEALSRDLEELLVAIGIKKKVIILCHDWGSMLGWRFAQFYESRVAALISVCVPFQPPSKKDYISLEDLVESVLPNFGYQLWFQQESSAPTINKSLELLIVPMASQKVRDFFWASLDAKGYDPEKSWARGDRFKKAFEKYQSSEKGKKMKGMLEEAVKDDPEAKYFLDTFRKNGVDGALRWYRVRALNHEQGKRLSPGFPTSIPALLFAPTRDDALPPELALMSAKQFEKHGAALEVQIIEGADHWVLDDVHYRDEITKRIGHFVDAVARGEVEEKRAGKKVLVDRWGKQEEERAVKKRESKL